MALHPQLKEMPDGSYVVLILHPDEGSTMFEFSDIEYVRRSEVNVCVDVSISILGDIVRFSGRMNMISTSAREAFARALGRIAKNKQEYDSYLSAAIVAVNDAIRAKPRVIQLCDAPQKNDNQWLLEPYILDKAPNILFGEGGGGKTYIALRWVLSLATGIPFLTSKPTRTVKCLFIDYEDDPAEGNDRIQKLCGGTKANIDLDLLHANILYFNPAGIPFADLVPTLTECIRANGVEFVLLDSAALACGGEPEKADSATRYFNSLAKLGVTSLTIAHETKSENHDHVFGSIFWRNSARNIWNAQSETNEADNRKISFGLFHRKCNHSAKRSAVSLEIFHGVGVVEVRPASQEAWGTGLSVPARIVAMLKQRPMELGELKDKLDDLTKDEIGVSLNRLKARGVVVQPAGRGGPWRLECMDECMDDLQKP